MKFPTGAIPAELPAEEYDRLVKLLTVHYAYPLPYPLAGEYFEQLFLTAIGGSKEDRKLLFDVVRGQVGWSLKTLLRGASLDNCTSFEVVIQRCDILRNSALSLADPVVGLGNAILRLFNDFCESSADIQEVTDPRSGFLIRSRDEKQFIFFQQRYRLYEPGDIRWQWANDDRRSLMGYAGESLVLRWYRSGTQLFGVHQIPEDAHKFKIDWRRAGLDETIEFFNSRHIAKAEKDS